MSVPALSLHCHRPPWAFLKFILGERARSEGKQMLISRVGLQGGERGGGTSNATALRNVEGDSVRRVWAQISRVEARMVFSELKWTLFCFCRLILLVRGHFLVMQSTTTQMMTTWSAPMIEAMRT